MTEWEIRDQRGEGGEWEEKGKMNENIRRLEEGGLGEDGIRVLSRSDRTTINRPSTIGRPRKSCRCRHLRNIPFSRPFITTNKRRGLLGTQWEIIPPLPP